MVFTDNSKCCCFMSVWFIFTGRWLGLTLTEIDYQLYKGSKTGAAGICPWVPEAARPQVYCVSFVFVFLTSNLLINTTKAKCQQQEKKESMCQHISKQHLNNSPLLSIILACLMFNPWGTRLTSYKESSADNVIIGMLVSWNLAHRLGHRLLLSGWIAKVRWHSNQWKQYACTLIANGQSYVSGSIQSTLFI